MGSKSFFLLLSLFAFAAQQSQAATATQEQTLAQVREEARRGKYQLISPEVLIDRFLKDPDSLLLVDTRQEWEYQREHIKGAVNLPIKTTWWTQYSLWARAAMRKILRTAKTRDVVFY